MGSMDVKVLDLLRATQIMRPAAPREHPAAPAVRPLYSRGNTIQGIFVNDAIVRMLNLVRQVLQL